MKELVVADTVIYKKDDKFEEETEVFLMEILKSCLKNSNVVSIHELDSKIDILPYYIGYLSTTLDELIKRDPKIRALIRKHVEVMKRKHS